MKNRIYYGDNLEVLRHFIKDETVDLCYIDPPFNSKRNYNQIYNNVGNEDKAQALAFVDTWTWDDCAEHGLNEVKANYNGVFTEQSIDLITGLEKVLKRGSLLAYLVSMTLRIAEIHRVLKPTGSFYFHCDPTASHYLKLVLDGVFCGQGGDFLNEIIWRYQTGGISKKWFGRKHDVIFLYVKSKKYQFYPERIKVPRTDEVLRRIERGTPEATRANTLEKLPDDVFDIQALNAMASERLGYPTQKPLALLERIIQASSNEGDVILDAYCGCGTTVAAAEKLGRNWIGIDMTYQSIALILKRLEEQSATALDNIEINGVPKDFDSAVALANKKDDRTRKEFEKWMVLTYSKNRAMIHEKKGGDGGIDGVAYISDRYAQGKIESKKVLFSVKSNKMLMPSMLNELNGVIERDGAACGIFLCLYSAPHLVKAAKSFGIYHNEFTHHDYPKIQVISVAELFAGARINLPNVNADILKKAAQQVAQSELSV
ncbi:site-specific DNA-methyltransferase [Chromatium weissei]|nr:site-specific DNA-methyltransferase [Chromatium weissei]